MLGSYGGVDTDKKTTCLQVSQHVVIDAGNIIQGLGKKGLAINHIFLSHSHLDHIVDIPFLIDNFYSQRQESLKIYGLPETLKAVKENLFGGDIWPDFSQIPLLGQSSPSMEFIPIEFEKKYEIDGVRLTPFPSNHTVPCCGFIIEKEGNGVIYSGDTFVTDRFWEIVNTRPSLHALIIDVSFPDFLENVAIASKHLTPKYFKTELEKLKRNDIKIYVNHLKPSFYDIIASQLEEINDHHIIIADDMLRIDYATGKCSHISGLISSELSKKVDHLTSVGIKLSSQANIKILLNSIVTEAKNLTNADGGTLYLLKDDTLHYTVVHNDTLGLHLSDDLIDWEPIPLQLKGGEKNFNTAATSCLLSDTYLSIPNVYDCKRFNFEEVRKFDEQHNYKAQSMLLVPLKNHKNKAIGLLQLINKQSLIDDDIIPFNEDDEHITRSLASQAAVALTNTQLVDDLEQLLESFLDSIIVAMGERSAYTKGHIHRMVELSVMIAQEINTDGSCYENIYFDPDEIRQIHFAALMHDIGKLTIPEYIIDKSVKLEAFINRAEVIQMRCDLIKSRYQNLLLEKKLEFLTSGNEKMVCSIEEETKKQLANLDESMDVIHRCNNGSERLSQELLDELSKVYEYQHHFDNETFSLITPDEYKHLSIERGTLTNDEREKIKDHAQASIDILEKLPFPDKYHKIPLIAGAHHEKINGKGYPQGLKGDEISFEARILAIADIFEALTAQDRPYKNGNSLTKALTILHTMATEGELDKKLVKFFYESGLYLQYARKFLPELQHEKVEISFSNL